MTPGILAEDGICAGSVPGQGVDYGAQRHQLCEKGTGVVTSEMTTNGVPRVTVVKTEIAVTR